MGFFDTLLTAIAPERAVKRVAAQTEIRAINSGYSNYGASLHKKSMRGWMWHGGSPKEDIEDNLRVLRERSRDAYMGVPLATGAIKTMRTNVVCGGLTPTPQIDNAFLGISDEEAQKINEQIAREFALWANKPTCDADRIDNFYMLQQLAFTGFLLNGDSWAVLQNKKTPGVPYDLRVRIIEADRICSPAFMDILSPTDINEHHVEKIVQGVETDADGMVIAYWVCDRHPLASTSVTGLTASHWTRVEAYGKKTGRQNVLCLMQRERAGQLRGVPLLAPVLESLKQLGRFTDAELTAAVISAMFTVFIKKSDQSDEVPFGEMLPPDVQVDTPDKTSVELAPGAFIDLNPGEEVQFADPKHPTTGFEAFMNAIVKQMAAALEIPSEVLYKQFSTSYSAARGALNEFWRTTGIETVESNGETARRVKIQITGADETYIMHQVGVYGRLNDDAETLLFIMQDARGVEVPSTKVNGDFEIELSALLAVSNKANISITVDPQMQALAKLVKAEIEKHNADASAHAATITAAVSAAVKNLSESGEILNEEQVKALIKEQVDGGTGGGYYGSYKLTLAADEWKPARSEDDYENAGGMDYYQCIYDAELSDSTSELVPVGVVSPGSFYTTTKAGVLNGCETHDGFIRFFAQRIPEADIQATVTLFGKGDGSGETGSVSIGQGLKRDASGAIAVRIGEGLDFDSANALTVRKETVMTSEDLLDEEETQQEIVDMLK